MSIRENVVLYLQPSPSLSIQNIVILVVNDFISHPYPYVLSSKWNSFLQDKAKSIFQLIHFITMKKILCFGYFIGNISL